MAQQQKQQDIQEFDYVKLFFHCLHKWYWFVLCIAICVGLAVLYLQCKTNVFSTAPAKDAGILKGDIITKIDNVSLNKMSDLRKYIYSKNWFALGRTISAS